jgi:4-methoxybenzoate monooxygenase (O-demethylating)
VESATSTALDIDPFSDEFLREPEPAYARLQAFGPVVHLPRYGVYAVVRHAEVRRVLLDPRRFISSAGVGLTNLRVEAGVRSPSVILEADPPAHDAPRAVLACILSNEALAAFRPHFRRMAEQFVARVAPLRTWDAIGDLVKPYMLQIFPDLVGLPPGDREPLLRYAEFLFNANGPRNARFAASAAEAERLSEWILSRCERGELRAGAFGDQVFQALDRGEIEREQAPLLVRSLLSAGIDTTLAGLGNTLACLIARPLAWSKLHQAPALARAAFDETLRFDPPALFAFRTTAEDVVLAGQPIPANTKLMLLFGAANRDPLRWEQPEQFDLERQNAGHLAFGAGIHACVGQIVARTEAAALLEVLAERFSALQFAAPPERRLNNSVRSYACLPVHASARQEPHPY